MAEKEDKYVPSLDEVKVSMADFGYPVEHAPNVHRLLSLLNAGADADSLLYDAPKAVGRQTHLYLKWINTMSGGEPLPDFDPTYEEGQAEDEAEEVDDSEAEAEDGAAEAEEPEEADETEEESPASETANSPVIRSPSSKFPRPMK